MIHLGILYLTIIVSVGLSIIFHVLFDPHIDKRRATLKELIWLFLRVGISIYLWGEMIYLGIKIIQFG